MSNDTEIHAVYEGYWLPRNTVLHDRYEIRDVIAEGGMGIVYLGYDPVLETKVSIKEYFPRRYECGYRRRYLFKYMPDPRQKSFGQSWINLLKKPGRLQDLEYLTALYPSRIFFMKMKPAIW